VETATDAVDRLEHTGWDWAFLDGPPAFTDLMEEMIKVADFIVVPIKPTTTDLLASEDTIALAKEAGARFLIVLNDVATKAMSEKARALLAKAKLPVADTEFSHRVSHQRGMNAGKSAAEARDPTAAAEIDALWGEIKRAASKAAKAKQREVRP
jgi:chromosome partitioning protein